MSILEIKDVTSGYGEVQILWGATMSLEPGKLTSLVGANQTHDLAFGEVECDVGERFKAAKVLGYAFYL